MNNKIKILIFTFLFFTVFSAFSQVSAPKYSNEFLAVGISGDALAMSNSVIASSRNVSSAYWNPAGLTRIQNDLQLGAMHSEYFAGIAKFDYLGGSYRLSDSSAFAVSMIRFGVDNIPNTLELIDNDGNVRYDRIKSFSVADYAFLFSYAGISKIEGLRYGANVKIIRRKAGDFASAWGFGLDAAAQYDYKKFKFGAMFRDVTSTFNAWSFNTDELEETFILTGNEIPQNSLELTLPKLLLGAAYTYDINDKFGFLTEIDGDVSFDGKRNTLVKSNFASIDPHWGAEINYRKIVFLRMGIGNFQKINDFDNKTSMSFQPNIGLGLKIKNLEIDYALTDIGDQSIALYSNIFSLRYSINKIQKSKNMID